MIVHDELDLPPAVLRVKVGGGLAGHNGLRSIKQHLHTDEFVRVRHRRRQAAVEGARRRPRAVTAFGSASASEMAVTIEEAADAVELIVTDGVDAAMNRYNTRPS